MAVETIGEAYMLGSRIHARCGWGRREAMKSVRGCLGKAELDLHTLVWTRGAAFPISQLDGRLKCPLCGSRRVALIFDLPKVPVAKRIVGVPSA
jgi:DNA-directed RNA polymerase subunit RPC12/RpoP